MSIKNHFHQQSEALPEWNLVEPISIIPYSQPAKVGKPLNWARIVQEQRKSVRSFRLDVGLTFNQLALVSALALNLKIRF